MKGNKKAAERLTELKKETRNITRLLNKVRRIHPSTWMKKVRLNLRTLLNSPGTVSAAIQRECLLVKLEEALDAVNAAMKISSSEELAHVRECIVGILNKFSGKTINPNNNTL